MISIRCLPEEIVYRIQINRLRDGSKVFGKDVFISDESNLKIDTRLANMLSCCETSDVGKTEEVIDILESSSDLSLLIELLNDPPKSINRRSAEPQPDSIPFPLMPRIFRLADKYNLSSEIMSALATHLEAHADAHPLRVYGLACQYALPSVADLASKHLLSPPLESYSTDEVAVIPTAEDYHKLLRLQMLRKQRLRQLLEEEDIFPYRYGECWTHVDYTRGRWNEARVSIALGLDAGVIAKKNSGFYVLHSLRLNLDRY